MHIMKKTSVPLYTTVLLALILSAYSFASAKGLGSGLKGPTFVASTTVYADLPAPIVSGSINNNYYSYAPTDPACIHRVRVLPYKVINGTKYFGTAYGQSNDVSDTGQEDVYSLDWSWSPVAGADGYTIHKYDSGCGWGGNYEFGMDVGNATWYLDGQGFNYFSLPQSPQLPFSVTVPTTQPGRKDGLVHQLQEAR